MYRFEMWYVDRSNDPYYHTNWSNRKKITVLADTRQEAFNKADAILGSLKARHRHWVYDIISITDHHIPEKEPEK